MKGGPKDGRFWCEACDYYYDEPNTLAAWTLRQLRVSWLRLTDRQMAAKMGKSTGYCGAAERGVPSFFAIKAYAELLGMDIEIRIHNEEHEFFINMEEA